MEGTLSACFTKARCVVTLIGFVLLLTPTGSLPSPRWRWPARVMAVTPVVLVLVVTLAGGPVDPRYQARGGPFDLRGLDGVLLAANRAALAVTFVGLVAAAASLVGRFRHARGVERLQLRWVHKAARFPWVLPRTSAAIT